MNFLKAALSAYFKMHPSYSIIFGYALYSVISAIILLQPYCHTVNITFIDDLFVSVSAMSTTGLTTVDISTAYTFWGQLSILVLMQIGGIGYMTFSSFVILAINQKISAYKKKILFSTFSFPSDFKLKEFVKNVVVFSLIAEVVGSLILSLLFWDRGVEDYVWNGIFHCVSAFCTAGFSTLSGGVSRFASDPQINFILCVLMLLGGMGFIVFFDAYKKIKKERSRLTFTSKVIIYVTTGFLFFGTLLFVLLEKSHENLTLIKQIGAAFFQLVSACTTTGFSTVNIGLLQTATLVLLIFFMSFGASPSGTGGGIKNTTFAALMALVLSTLRRQEYVTLYGTEIPQKRVQLATAIFAFYMFILITGIFLITLFEDLPFKNIVFEVVSALGNVGISTGITPDLTSYSKILLMVLMFISRAGVLTFGFSLIPQDTSERPRGQKKDLIF